MKKSIITIYTLFFMLTLFAQNTGDLAGKVYQQSNNEALAGVNVYIPEIKKGTTTDLEGNFILRHINPGTYTVEVSLLGYEKKKIKDVSIKAGETTRLDISLKKSNISLNEVVISATKNNKTIKKIGSPVYVIDSLELERTEGRNIEEALLRVPGVFTEDRFHNETNIVSFRGVGLHTHVTSGILVLVDGVSLTSAMGRTDFEGVDLDNAEKIEILKGPVSALYGPNAITGVINIVEKLPREGFHGKAKASYGSYNTTSVYADVNGGKGNFRYLVKGKYFATDGSLDYRNTSGSIRGGIKLIQLLKNNSKLQFTADYIDSDMDLPGTFDREDFDNRETVPTNPNLFAGYERQFLRTNLVYTRKTGVHSNLFSNVYYLNRHSEGLYSDRGFSDDDSHSIGGEIRNQWKNELFGKKNSLIAGISLLNEDGENEYYKRNTTTGELEEMTSKGESIYTLLGLYMEDEFNLSDKFSVTLGVRYDMVNYDWTDLFNQGEDNTSNSTQISSVSPKFGFAFNPKDNLTLFGNVARGFRPPQITQLFVGSAYGGIANPDLKPEYLTNYELGVRGNFNKKWFYQLSLYEMDFTDQITAEIVPEIDPHTPVYQNVGETVHKGVETSLEYKIAKSFDAYVNYSYLDAHFIDNPEYEDNTLRKTPHNMLNSGIRYHFGFGLSVAVDYKFVDEYYMDNQETYVYEGYSVTNLKFTYKNKGFMAAFAVNNIFDENYATYAYASQKYDRTTHQMVWTDKYIPGWPVNVNFSLGYKF